MPGRKLTEPLVYNLSTEGCYYNGVVCGNLACVIPVWPGE